MNTLEEALAKLQKDKPATTASAPVRQPTDANPRQAIAAPPVEVNQFNWTGIKEAILSGAILAPLELTIPNHNERMAFRRRIYRLVAQKGVLPHKITMYGDKLLLERKYETRAIGVVKQKESS